MTFYIEEFVNGVKVATQPVGLHPLHATLTAGEVVHFDIVNSLGKIPAFDPTNPLNWNHTNSADSLMWNSATGRSTYTENVAGTDSLAVTFEVAGRFHTGYVSINY